MDNAWVIDVEGDGLIPKKLYCLSASSPKTISNIRTTSDYEVMKKFLKGAKYIIGHNIIRWDIPQIERLLGIKIKAKLIDTLPLSWALYPTRQAHNLDSWGNDLGVAKPVILDWENLSQEQYEHRCSEDVKINILLWQKIERKLIDLYGSSKKAMKFIEYTSFKMHCAMLQEKSKWKVDIDFVKTSIKELQEEIEAKTNELREVMPKVPLYQVKNKPKKFINAVGEYTKLGSEWIALLSSRGLPPDHEEEVKIVKGYEDGNPGSHDQIKKWLYSLGWVPQTFKYVKDKTTGKTKAIPQISLEHNKGICPSIQALYEKEPRLDLLENLSVASHRLSVLKAFLREETNGELIAAISGFTNTMRFKHSILVNLPKINKPYAAPIRSSLISRDGKILCGSDMSSLEDRIKQSFIYKYDPDYVDAMNTEGFDPHLVIAGMAAMMTQQEIEEYKNGNTKNKPIRDIAKNGNYACQYGAGPPRLVLTCGISLEKARQLHEAYWKLNWAIKEVADEQVTKVLDDQMWLLNPINGFWYSLRTQKDVFSTLVQGTAAYVFDLWVEEILKQREQITAQFHDEVVLEITEGYEEECSKMIRNAIDIVNSKLPLNRELDVSIQFGKRYSEIH